MALYEVALTTGPQAFAVDLPGGTFRIRLAYVEGPEGGWRFDLGEADGTPLVCGIPLLPGIDLLAPYAYLGVGARLTVVTPGEPSHVPGFADLGSTTKLYVEPN